MAWRPSYRVSGTVRLWLWLVLVFYLVCYFIMYVLSPTWVESTLTIYRNTNTSHGLHMSLRPHQVDACNGLIISIYLPDTLLCSICHIYLPNGFVRSFPWVNPTNCTISSQERSRSFTSSSSFSFHSSSRILNSAIFKRTNVKKICSSASPRAF
jgi:hypothetical protein